MISHKKKKKYNNKVLIQRKILSRETILSAYTHTHTHSPPNTRV